MRIAPLAALFAVAGCSFIPGTAANLERIARAKLMPVLNDGESARFMGLQRSMTGAERGICGEVNAKNAMGAYVGFRRFVVSQDAEFAVIDPQANARSADQETAYQAGFDSVWKHCPQAKG